MIYVNKKLYIGNIPYDITQAELEELFGKAGEVTEVVLVTDRQTGRPRGFAFVEMADEEGAKKAIQELNGHQLKGRSLLVDEARPPRENFRSDSGRGFKDRRSKRY